MKALVVEDDKASRLILVRFLSPFAEIETAVDGLEAIRALRTAMEEKEPFELVCLDIMMPKIDGQAVLKELRAMEKRMFDLPKRRARVFMTSALNNKTNVLLAIPNCDAYLVKPINRSLLIFYLKKCGLVAGNPETPHPHAAR